MLKNYIITTLRHFWKNKSFSAINIAGLGVKHGCLPFTDHAG
jgi:hypothetical protein